MPGPRARRLVRRAHRTGWFAAAVLALLAGCTSGSRAGSPPSGSRLTAALGHWASFPASSAMRPVVLSGDQATAPDFPIGADKIDFITGAISFPRSLPSGPSTSGGYPVISATRAASVLTSDGAAHVSQPSTRLTVTGVKLGTGVFGTDRGRQALPAWQFRFRGVSGTASVLAVAASGRFWPAGLNQVTTHLSAAQPGRSGRALTLTAEGAQAGTGPCQASYSVRQQSSAHAVAVYVVAVQHGSQGGCASVGYRVALAVPLPAPLGNRVLVDAATFAPIPVTQPLVSSS